MQIVFDFISGNWYTGYVRIFNPKTMLPECVYDFDVGHALLTLYPLCDVIVKPYGIFRPNFESPNEFYKIETFSSLTSAITDKDLKDLFGHFRTYSNKTAAKVFNMVMELCRIYEFRFYQIVSLYFSSVCHGCRTFKCYNCSLHKFIEFCDSFFHKYNFELTYTHLYFVLAIATRIHSQWGPSSEEGDRIGRKFAKSIYAHIKKFTARNRNPDKCDKVLFEQQLMLTEFPLIDDENSEK